MSLRQRGASLLIPVLLLVVVGAFAALVAATQSGGDIHGSAAQADSVEALLLAESGIERATRRFLSGAACSAAGLGETLNDLTSIGFGASGRSITISAGANSDQDFAGATLPATRCRIQVTGRITASNVARTLQAIIDRDDNYVGEVAVAGFDNPPGNNPVASWTGGFYDYTGGSLGGANPPNCTRSAYLVKPNAGAGTPASSSAGTAPVSFTINQPATVTVSFDYRIIEIRDANDDTCRTNSGVLSCTTTSPVFEATPEGNNGDAEICFTLRDTAGVIYNSTRVEVDRSVNNSGGGQPRVLPPSCTPTNQQIPADPDFSPCSALYNNSGGTPNAVATVSFTFGGAGPLSFDQIGFKMYRAGGGNAYEMWLDNIRVTPSAAIAGIAAWRDCAVSACPGV
jgi:hypothetical protein